MDNNIHEKKSVKIIRWLMILAALVIIVAFVTFIFRNIVFKPGGSFGIDSSSFNHTAKVIADYYRDHLKAPAIDPAWYNDFEIKYAPPLIYPPIILLYYITGDSSFAGNINYYLIALMSAMIMFFVIRKKFSTLNALVGSLLWVVSPIIFEEPRTKALAAMFIPLAFYFTNEVLEKKKYKYVLILSIVFALAILAHAAAAVSIVATLIFYGLFYIIFNKKDGKGFFLLLFAPVIAFLLTSFYIIPYIFEGGAWTRVASAIKGSVEPLTLLLFLGIIPLVMSIYSVIKKPDAKKMALFVTSLIAAFLSLGGNVPINFLLPFTRPGMRLFFATFGFIFLAVTAIDFSKTEKLKNILLKLAIMLIILAGGLYFSFYINHFTKIQLPSKINHQDEFISQFEQKSGRIMPLTREFKSGLIAWEALVEQTNLNSNDGHYYALTRTKLISWIMDNIHYGYPKLAINALEHQNTSFVLMNPKFFKKVEQYFKEPETMDPFEKNATRYDIDFLKSLEEGNFKNSFENKDFTVYENNSKSQYLQPINEKILIIGRSGNPAAAVLSADGLQSIQGATVFVDDYELDFLKNFDTLILYGFSYHDKQAAESLIKEYASGGGSVLIDLWGMQQSKLEDLPSFMGVTGIKKTMKDNFSLEKNNGSSDALPTYFGLPSEYSNYDIFLNPNKDDRGILKEWRFMSYIGLDKAFLKTNTDNESTDVLGYKEIKGSKIWFLGPNLFYHAFLTHDQQKITFLGDLIKDNRNTSVDNREFIIHDETLETEYKEFTYSANQTTPLLVSFTYSPHWQAYVDGKKIKVYNLENLMGINLPAGSHEVELQYERNNPPTHTIGNWLTIVTLIIILLPFIIITIREITKGKR